MRFPRVKISSNKGRRKSSSAALQNGEKKIDGGGGTHSSRQVAPETTHFGSVDYGSSRDDTFFEACPWLDSDCDDEFYSVNGDLTPARSIASHQSSSKADIIVPPPAGSPKKLPTLGAILKAEPLKPQRKLADLLRETQDGDSSDLSRADSFRAGQEAGRCCVPVPQLARAVSCDGSRGRRRRRNN